MRSKRAVEKLRILAEACERVKIFWFDTEPFLKAVHAFGEVVDRADPLDAVQVAVAINLSPEEVPWEAVVGSVAGSKAAGEHDGKPRQPPTAKLRGPQGPPRPVGRA